MPPESVSASPPDVATGSDPEAEAAAYVARLTARVNERLAALDVPAEPALLYDPVRYVLDGGGKRLRPVLLLAAAEVFGAPVERAMPAALAVEVFHNFTLVHDDIMDHAEERRGRPAVHVVWDESTAILAGDYMMGLAYDLLARTETTRLAEIVRTFHTMVARLCEGQALDEAFEARAEVSVPEYLDMIDRKTGALIECVLALGGLVGGATDEQRHALAEAGRTWGRAFQIQDDLLDLTAEGDGWGKAIGGDLVEGKKTYLLLRALERAEGPARAWFRRIVADGGLPADMVPEARERMADLGVLDDARRQALGLYAAGERALDALPAGAARERLRWLAGRMARRIR